MDFQNKSRSCLIIKNDGIGDLILASGLITEISKIFKRQMDLVTCEQNREIVDMIDGVRTPYYISRDGLRFWPYISRMGMTIPRIQKDDHDVIKRIQKIKYDYVIVLRRFIRQSTLILMSKIRAKHKYCTWQFPTNTTAVIARRFSTSFEHIIGDLRELSELTYLRHFVEKIFEKKFDPAPKLNIPLTAQNHNKEKNAGLCIGGHSGIWPVRNWLELIEGLQKRGYRIFLFGGENDKKLGEILEQNADRLVNKIGELSFEGSIKYLQQLEILFGNDTGFTHFASLLVNKIFIILGGGTFRRFFPWPGNKNQHVIYYGLPCFDCDWECLYSQHLCVNMIGPGNMLEYFDEVMSGKNSQNQNNLNPNFCQYKIAWRRRPWEKVFADC